jgi:hypothetical protein
MASANDQGLISAKIQERTKGAWSASIDVDTDEELAPVVTFEIEGIEWRGTVTRGELDAGRYRCRLVGGAGGLQKPVKPLWYDAGPSVSLIARDILRVGGEVLSPDSDVAVVGHRLNAYHRAKGTVAEALSAVVERFPGATWRVLRDGTVWIGIDSFPELESDENVDIETDPMPASGRYEIAPETPLAYPGVTYSGRCVTEVTTYLSGTKLRQELLCVSETSQNQTSEQQADRRIDRKLDYSRMYTAEVISQSGKFVDVMPDDERIRGQGITRVPLRLGMPGVEVTFPPRSIVLIGWENSDPSKPFASLWLMGAALTSMVITGDVTINGTLRVEGEASAQSVASDGDVTGVQAPVGALPAVSISLISHIHGSSAGPTDIPKPTSN